MSGFTESLTVKIKADSHELSDELTKIQERLKEMANSFSSLGNADQGLSRLSSRIAGMTGPLQNVSQLLQQVIAQMQLLSNVSVNINVAPAIQSLAQLSGMIAATATQLQMLSAMSMVGGSLGGVATGGPRIPFPGIPQFDRGGLVQGRTGIDRIPAMLSHGEFVIRSSAVDKLGVAFFDQLNRGELRPLRSAASVNNSAIPNFNSGHHIREVHVHVQNPGDIHQLIREMKLSDRNLRIMRG